MCPLHELAMGFSLPILFGFSDEAEPTQRPYFKSESHCSESLRVVLGRLK